MKGKIKYYNEKKGFGFIMGEDNKDYFFHVSQIQGEDVIPQTDGNVEFTATKNEKGNSAENILVV